MITRTLLEGQHRAWILELELNCVDNSIQFFVDFLQHDSHHPPASSSHPCVAMHVVGALVSVTIDFDNESRSNTCEVGDIRTDRMLPAELNAKAFGTEPLPDSLLDTCHPQP